MSESNRRPSDERKLVLAGAMGLAIAAVCTHCALRQGKANRSLVLHDDFVAHEVISHYTRVLVRSDWARGLRANTQDPLLVGTIHAGRNDVTIRRAGSF